jgi:hypothetical protein
MIGQFSIFLHFFDTQASSLQRHCTADPVTFKTCDIYIAILSYVKTSYSLTASTRNGFKSRVTLITGQPQIGPAVPFLPVIAIAPCPTKFSPLCPDYRIDGFFFYSLRLTSHDVLTVFEPVQRSALSLASAVPLILH